MMLKVSELKQYVINWVNEINKMNFCYISENYFSQNIYYLIEIHLNLIIFVRYEDRA